MIETERLILRPWLKDDILPFSAINSDEEVMEYLPKNVEVVYDMDTDRFLDSLIEAAGRCL